MTEIDNKKISAEIATLRADDDRSIPVFLWEIGQPRAQIHLFHGLGEHPARYERFANACKTAGYNLAAHSHRGHGPLTEGEALGHYADRDGWKKLISDAAQVQRHVVARWPNVPLVLLGHSMGSYIAQSFMMRDHGVAKALVLSGSTYATRSQLRVARWLAAAMCILRGKRRSSGLLNKLGFGDFNKRFAPNRTAFDWLSRDEAEVDKYVVDRLCGAESSNRLWFDLMGGLLEVTSRRSLAKINGGMPVLITGGSNDPVGGKKGLTRLADAYLASGHSDVTLKLYLNGRHEMFNETNHNEFTQDMLDWIFDKAVTGSAR